MTAADFGGISALARDVAFHVLRTNKTGRSSPGIAFTALQNAFPDHEKNILEEAVAELKYYGYVTVFSTVVYPIHSINPTARLFLGFDQAVTGLDTPADAVQIARQWLEDQSLTNIFRLDEHLGWEPRRLNPALGALHLVLPESCWSGEMHSKLTSTSINLTPDVRFLLRKIVQTGPDFWG